MKRLENGDFALELELPAGQEHAFRFVIDGVRWGERLERRQVRLVLTSRNARTPWS